MLSSLPDMAVEGGQSVSCAAFTACSVTTSGAVRNFCVAGPTSKWASPSLVEMVTFFKM